MKTIIIAFGLFLILEGIGPGLFPKAWRNMLDQIAQQPDSQLKKMGTGLIIIGAALVLFMTH